jgi:hypothetical protein
MKEELLPIARYMHNLILMGKGKFAVIERATQKYNLTPMEAAEIYTAATVIFEDAPGLTVQAYVNANIKDAARSKDVMASLTFGGHNPKAKLTEKNWAAIYRMIHRNPKPLQATASTGTEITSMDRCTICNGRTNRVTLANKRVATICPIHNVVFPTLPEN